MPEIVSGKEVQRLRVQPTRALNEAYTENTGDQEKDPLVGTGPLSAQQESDRQAGKREAGPRKNWE